MENLKPIKIGMLGLGRAGNGMHRPELAPRGEKFQIYAVCDELPERCDVFAEQFGSKKYLTYEEMLADPEVELIDIATRSCDHYKHAKMALEAGKDVFLEKPFCTNAEDAQKLIDLGSNPAGPHLYLRHNRRLEAGFEKVNEIIDSGVLGEVFTVKMTRNGFGRRNDWQTISEFGGGQLLNWGPHIIDHSLRFCGGSYKIMYSNIQHCVAAGDCEDFVKIVFTGENGRIVDMEIGGATAVETNQYLIYGTKDALWSEGDDDLTLHIRYLDPDYPLEPIEANPNTPGADGSFGNTETLHFKEESFHVPDSQIDRIWDSLYASVRENKPYPVPLSQALQVMQVIDEVKKHSVFCPKK